MERKRLSDQEVARELAGLSGWSVQTGKLRKQFMFQDFTRAFSFMAQVALIAQAMDHHPDWCNAYNRVIIELTTHDLGGISTFDVELARRVDLLLA